MASARLNSPNQPHDEASLNPKPKSQAQSRYMFVEYAAPAAPQPLGTKKRRGGPSEVRAHITKEFHRRLRVKRLGSLNPSPPRDDNTSDAPNPPDPTCDVQVPATGPTFLPDRTWLKDLTPEEDREEHKAASIEQVNATPPSPDNASPDPQRRGSTSRTPPQPTSPRIATTLLLGESNMDPFEVLPVNTAPSFIRHVLKHGMSLPNSVFIFHVSPGPTLVLTLYP